jgi:UDP-glucose 4-epimerase
VIDPSWRFNPGAVLSNTTIVVTGGAGFIGGHVVAHLMAAGATVKVIDDLSAGTLDNLRGSLDAGLNDSDIRICDIRTPDASASILRWRPDIVVHLAAQASLPAAIRSPVLDADINIRGTVSLLGACADSGVGLMVYAASSAIYGDVAEQALPVTETAPFAPTSPYGLSKATALKYVDWYYRHHRLPYTALVLGNVYGPRPDSPDCGAVSRMAHALASGRQHTIIGDGGQTRDFVFVADVAEAVTRACASWGAGLVNIGSGVETPVAEIARLVARSAGLSRVPRHAGLVAAEVRRMVLDVSRAASVLSWRPTTMLPEGVRATMQAAQHGADVKEAS